MRAKRDKAMARPKGSKTEAHAFRRSEILQRLKLRLSQRDAMHASFRDLVAAAGVSISTLQHYFGRRADIVAAVLSEAAKNAEPHFDHARQPDGDFEASVQSVLAYTRLGFERFGVGDLHALALVEGLQNSIIGPVVVDAVLEPSIEAIASRLAAHQRRGEMLADNDPRFAALSLLAPLVLLMLHQHSLNGALCHKVDIDAFLLQHARAFVRAHGTKNRAS
jgi:AcrR family transcriptional regulator